jgi:hypothetical protein
MLKAIGRALARVWRQRRRSDLCGFQDQRETHRFRDQRAAAEACGTGTRVQVSGTGS